MSEVRRATATIVHLSMIAIAVGAFLVCVACLYAARWCQYASRRPPRRTLQLGAWVPTGPEPLLVTESRASGAV